MASHPAEHHPKSGRVAKRLDASGYDTDKWPELLQSYEEAFSPFVDQDVVLLELGVHRGGSLKLWRDYFIRGRIIGLDTERCQIDDPTGRIRVYHGSQDDIALLDRLARTEAPNGFDIIIDDASHVGHLTRTSFWHLFTHQLKPGGYYAIEDWETGYWGSWRDGHDYAWAPDSPLREDWRPRASPPESTREYPSHLYGMVGVIKELVDEVARGEIVKGGPSGTSALGPRISQLRIQTGLVLATKSLSDCQQVSSS